MLSVIAVPVQSVVGDALIVPVAGNAFTVTEVVVAVAVVHPVPG